MKKYSLLIILLIINNLIVLAQNDSTINSLKASNSLTGNLLGFTPSEITSISEKPKFLTELSQVSAKTENFTILPKSFAFDIAPFKAFSKSAKNNWLNEAVISVGYKNNEEVDLNKNIPEESQLALGFGFNFFPKKSLSISKKTESKSLQFRTKGTELRDKMTFKEFYENDPEIMEIAKTNPVVLRDNNINVLFNGYEKNKLLNKEFKKIKNRYNFIKNISYNVSAGLVLSQITKDIDRYGAWSLISIPLNKEQKDKEADEIRGQKETQDNLIILVKYLNNYRGESQFQKLDSTKYSFEAGLKYTYHNQSNIRYFIEIEALGRYNYGLQKIKDSNIIEKEKWIFTSKYDINFGYELAKNFVITASFGKDFGNNTITRKTGNLFALLNLAGGIGANKEKK